MLKTCNLIEDALFTLQYDGSVSEVFRIFATESWVKIIEEDFSYFVNKFQSTLAARKANLNSKVWYSQIAWIFSV